MGENSKISWCDSTFNPWLGCQRVSPGCGGSDGGGCYAEVSTPVRVHRAKGLELWGPPKTTSRARTSDENWKLPARWNRAAVKAGTRTRVFCASLCDVFEDHPQVAPWRAEALALLEKCTSLDVQLLTKRPENIRRMVPPHWLTAWPSHVWVGTTVEDQKRAEERIPHLLDLPAIVRFLSCDPLLGPLDLSRVNVFKSPPWPASLPGEPETYMNVLNGQGLRPSNFGVSIETTFPRSISWVIVGGESGSEARPFDIAWARSIITQCREAGVPVFMKQTGAHPVDSARAMVTQPCFVGGKPMLRDTIYRADSPEVAQARIDEKDESLHLARPHVSHPLRVRTKDRAGADPSEWPRDMRVQEFPGVFNG